MNRRFTLYMVVIIIIIIIITSCGNEVQTRPPGSTSVGGAVIKTTLELKDEFESIELQTNFDPNQEFYFYFHNNLPFGSEQITVQLISNSDDRILAETNYDVNPEEIEWYDKVWFGSRGMYTIAVKIDSEVRATREVVIEQ